MRNKQWAWVIAAYQRLIPTNGHHIWPANAQDRRDSIAHDQEKKQFSCLNETINQTNGQHKSPASNKKSINIWERTIRVLTVWFKMLPKVALPLLCLFIGQVSAGKFLV